VLLAGLENGRKWEALSNDTNFYHSTRYFILLKDSSIIIAFLINHGYIHCGVSIGD
jgi:hypothetical protein